MKLADQVGADSLGHGREVGIIHWACVAKIEIADRVKRDQMEMCVGHLEADDRHADSAGPGRLTNGVR